MTLPPKRRKKARNSRYTKSKKRVVGIFKLLILSFFCVLTALLVLTGFAFHKFIRSPFASSVNTSGGSLSFTEPFSLSFVVLSDIEESSSKIERLALVVVNPLDQTLSVFDVAPNLIVTYPQNLGEGEINKVYALGQLVEEDKGVDFVNRALYKLFAKKPDKYIVIDAEAYSSVLESLEIDKLSKLSNIAKLKSALKYKDILLTVYGKAKTDLSSVEILGFLKWFRGLSKDFISYHAVNTTEVNVLSGLDLILSPIFSNNLIIDEGYRVQILNGSGIFGVGALVSRNLENLGLSVVSVGNATQIYDKSIIVSDINPFTSSLSVVANELSIEGTQRIVEFPNSVAENAGNADITIIIGVDWGSRL
ncbi:MAG: LCP family protein [Patescibacteria group bacterium]